MRSIKQAGAGERTLMELEASEAAGITGPATVDGIGPSDAWRQYWRTVDERRRSAAPWLSREQ
jgi:hypothetical protein